MALPPTLPEDDQDGDLELAENCFEFSGNALEYLKPFRVVDLDDGMRQMSVHLHEELQISRSGDEMAPGSVHSSGTIKVYFTPARPGNRYRCEFATGTRIGRLRPDAAPSAPGVQEPRP